jgi:hypothetical protein
VVGPYDATACDGVARWVGGDHEADGAAVGDLAEIDTARGQLSGVEIVDRDCGEHIDH